MIAHPLGGDDGAVLLCVFDGHGNAGDAVSRYILHSMHDELDLRCKPEVLRRNPERVLTAAFESVHDELAARAAGKSTHHDLTSASDRGAVHVVDASQSGACSLVVYLRGRKLWIANAGDCCCVLATGASSSKLGAPSIGCDSTLVDGGLQRLRLNESSAPTVLFRACKLSTEHKPDLPSEKRRIEGLGGWVRPVEIDSDGGLLNPSRLYQARGEENRWKGPGLAISRSIGDLGATSCGMIATPEVRMHELRLPSLPQASEGGPATRTVASGRQAEEPNEEDAFLIIASDGVWEFFSADDAVIVATRT